MDALKDKTWIKCYFSFNGIWPVVCWYLTKRHVDFENKNSIFILEDTATSRLVSSRLRPYTQSGVRLGTMGNSHLSSSKRVQSSRVSKNTDQLVKSSSTTINEEAESNEESF